MKNKIYIGIKLIITFIISFWLVNEIKIYAAFNLSGITFYYIYENIIIKLLYLILGILIFLYIYSIIKNAIDDKRYLKKNEAELDQIKKYSELLKDQNKLNENEKIDDLFKEKNDAELNFAPLYTKQEENVDKKNENKRNKKIKIKSEVKAEEKEIDSNDLDEKKNRKAETEEKEKMLEELGLLERTSDIIENNYDKILNKTAKKSDYKYKNQPNLFPIVDDNYIFKYKIFNELEKIMEEYEFDLASVDIETYVSPKEYIQIHTAYNNYLNAKNEITKKLEEDTVKEISESINTHKEKKTSKTNKLENKKDISITEKYYDLDGVVLKQLVKNIRKVENDDADFSDNDNELKVQTPEEVKNAASIVLDVLIDKIKKLDEKEKENEKLNKESKKNVSKIKIKQSKVSENKEKEENKVYKNSNKRNKVAPRISLDLKIEKLESFKETLKTSDLFKRKN